MPYQQLIYLSHIQALKIKSQPFCGTNSYLILIQITHALCTIYVYALLAHRYHIISLVFHYQLQINLYLFRSNC